MSLENFRLGIHSLESFPKVLRKKSCPGEKEILVQYYFQSLSLGLDYHSSNLSLLYCILSRFLIGTSTLVRLTNCHCLVSAVTWICTEI